MYEIKKDQTAAVSFLAGDFPIVAEAEKVKTGEAVRKFAPVSMTDDGIVEVTVANLAQLFGIAASDSTDVGVVCYLTGEFFADALVLNDSVTVKALKSTFRKLSIFLK